MRFVLVLLALGAPAAASADVVVQGRTIPCYCTDTYGERAELGERRCLVVDGRAFMGLCEMALNVPIWRDTGAGCVSSGLERGVRPQASPPNAPPSAPAARG